ncbi:hypothetical protein ACFWWM_43315 [Streptomyces sp. NPDC058682]|uniref:hypothetical protein n=1 Tax=Streptomyces sp. NPDC058682 TaxID=3346596 RepID=UPI0036674C21
MSQSLSHHLPWLPWGHKGSKQIGIGGVVVIVVVAAILSLALSAAQIATCTGFLTAITGVAALIRSPERGDPPQHA